MGKRKRSERDLQEVIEQTAGAVVALEAAETTEASQQQLPRKRGRPKKIIQKSLEIKGRRAKSKSKEKTSEEEEEDDDDEDEKEEETELIEVKKKQKGIVIESSYTEGGEAADKKNKQGSSHDNEEEQEEEKPKVEMMEKKSRGRRKGKPRKSSIN